MGCEFCNKEGLPIFPVRAAVVEKDSSFIPLPAEFTVDEEAAGDMFYSARTLRSGFLYVYDEKAEKWKDYFITPEGYYACLPLGLPPSPALIEGKKPCADKPDEVARASFITVPVDINNPDNNGNFYLCWASHAWTKDIRTAHEKVSHREEHMQLFDVKKWLKESKHEQALSIDALKENVVAEYHSNYTTKISAPFKFSSIDWCPAEPGVADNICKASDALAPKKGVILNLSDPVAIAHDIGFLIPYLIDKNYYSNHKYMREYILSTSISQIKEALCEQFELSRIQASMEMENKYEYGYFDGEYSIPPIPKNVDVLYNTTQENFKGWAENEWAEKYGSKYDNSLKEAFDKEFNAALTEYDQSCIFPMAELHRKIIEHTKMLSYFNHNFDENDIDSGIAFVDNLTLCLACTQDKIPCFEKYVSWLKGSSQDIDNLLLRALSLNQKELREKIIQVTNGSPTKVTEIAQLPWGTLAVEFGEYFKSKIPKVDESIANLISTVTGPVTEIVKESIKNKVVPEALTVMAVVQKKRIGIFVISGTRESFISGLTTRIMNAMGLKGKAVRTEMTPEIRAKVRQLEGLGLKFNGASVETEFLAIYDYDALEKLENKSLITKIKNGAKAIFKPKEALAFMSREGNENILELWENKPKGQNYIEIDEPVRPKRQSNTSNKNAPTQTSPQVPTALPEQSPTPQVNSGGKATVDSISKAKIPYISNILGAVLQGTTVIVMATEVGNGLEDKKVEGWMRFSANVSYFLGNLMGVAEKRLLYLAEVAARATMQGVVKTLAMRFFAKAAIFLTGIGGIIMAYYDFENMDEQRVRGNRGLSFLYWSSGILTIALIFTFIYAPYIGVLLVAALIIVSVLIGFNADNDIQHWLERTLWGINKFNNCSSETVCKEEVLFEKYTSMEQEISELNAALEG